MKPLLLTIVATLGIGGLIAGIASASVLVRLLVLVVPSSIAGWLAMSLAQDANLDPALVKAIACFVSVFVTCVQGVLIARAASVLGLVVNGASFVAGVYFVGLFFVTSPMKVDPATEAWWHRDGSPRLFASSTSGDAEYYDRPGVSASGDKLVPVTRELRAKWEEARRRAPVIERRSDARPLHEKWLKVLATVRETLI